MSNEKFFWEKNFRSAFSKSRKLKETLRRRPLKRNIKLREVTFGSHLRKHLRLLVGYCETSVTGSHARLDHNVNSESTWSLETSIPQDFSVIEILQNEKYITKSSKYSTYDLYPTGRFFHYNRNLNYSAPIITKISTSKGVNYFV